MRMYVAGAWYWRVGGDETQLYSSAARGYVSVEDPDYVIWAREGGVPTNIQSEADLWDVLRDQAPEGLPAPPPLPQ